MRSLEMVGMDLGRAVWPGGVSRGAGPQGVAESRVWVCERGHQGVGVRPFWGGVGMGEACGAWQGTKELLT